MMLSPVRMHASSSPATARPQLPGTLLRTHSLGPVGVATGQHNRWRRLWYMCAASASASASPKVHSAGPAGVHASRQARMSPTLPVAEVLAMAGAKRQLLPATSRCDTFLCSDKGARGATGQQGSWLPLCQSTAGHFDKKHAHAQQ